MAQYAYLLRKLQSMKEGDSTVLDNSMILFGSALSDGNSHNPHKLPVVLGGRGGGRIDAGQHRMYTEDTPLSNLYVSMLDAFGTPVERFARQHRPAAGRAGIRRIRCGDCLRLAAGLLVSALLLPAADITGTGWARYRAAGATRYRTVAFRFVQKGTALTGKLYLDYGSSPILKGTVEGDQITFPGSGARAGRQSRSMNPS